MVVCTWTYFVLLTAHVGLAGLLFAAVTDAVESTNLALASAGAYCAESNYAILGPTYNDCKYAIDGKTTDSGGWFARRDQVVGAWIDIEFRRTSIIDKLRLLQSQIGYERIKQMEAVYQPGGQRQILDFPDYGSSKRWLEFSVASIRADSVRLTIVSVYSEINNGFYEIEVYGIDARSAPQPTAPPQPTPPQTPPQPRPPQPISSQPTMARQPGSSVAAPTVTSPGMPAATEKDVGGGVEKRTGDMCSPLPLFVGLLVGIGGVILGSIVTSLICWFGCRRRSQSPHEQFLNRTKA